MRDKNYTACLVKFSALFYQYFHAHCVYLHITMPPILNHKIIGQDGPDLIILHGFLGSLDNWQTLAHKLAVHFRVIIVDARNHGRSFHAISHTLDDMAEDLKQLASHLHLTSFYLIGHSMGGKVAMLYAWLFPHRVRKLIVADIAPKPYPRGHDSVFLALHAVDITTLTSRKEAEERMMPVLQDMSVAQFLLKSLVRNDRGGFEWRFNLPVLEKEYEQIMLDLPASLRVPTPTLFLKGARSGYIKPEDEPRIHLLFEHAEIDIIGGAGHWIHADQPQLFLDSVERFLHS